MRERLRALPGVTVHDLGRIRCGIVTFSTDRLEADVIQQKLREQGINVSTTNPSATLLDSTARRLPTTVRASVHYYNTEGEIERFCATLRGLL